MSEQVHIAGFTAPSAERWVQLTSGQNKAWIRYSAFHGGAKSATEQLALKDFVIVGAPRMKAVVEKVAAIDDFPARDLIEQIGWNSPHFCLPDGTVFSPFGIVPGEILFDPIAKRTSQRGSLKRWKSKVASPLIGQKLLTFCLSLAFVAPLLKLTNRVGNIGFELVGGKGTGKSTAQQIMSSVLGGAIQSEDGHYWQTFDATLNALEQAMESHSDMPMILEEANLFLAGGTPRMRGEHFKAFAFRLGMGSEKSRFGGAPPREFRLVYLTSSNESLASLIGVNSEAARAAEDRLITIQIPADRPHGIFDSIPAGYDNGSEFANALVQAADANHGVAIRQFLQKLVDARASDEPRLRDDIQGWITQFRVKAKVDLNDGSAARVADAFGLVYAAGCLASRYGALPKDFACGPAALACYRLHLARGGQPTSLKELLTAIARQPNVIDFGRGKVPELDPADHAAAVAFTRSRQTGRELWIDPLKIGELIPGWTALQSRADVRALLKRDGKHLTIKRPAGPNGEQKRVYCFPVSEQA